jgi:hypothetical protein
MDSRSNSTSGLGLPQPGNDMGQLPPIHTPQSFHAPDTAATHFDTAAPQIGTAAPAIQPMQFAEPADPQVQSAAVEPAEPIATPQEEQDDATGNQFSVAPIDDTDTAFDEEWVERARQVISRTHSDPYLQSQELGKLKAQYIKLRYNKDIKVSD